MVVGLYLLSLMDADTSVATASAYMFVLGLGLGLVMQVLVLAVQNAVDVQRARRRDLGRDAVPLDRRLVRRLRARRGLREPARPTTSPQAFPGAAESGGGGRLQPRRPRAAAAGRARRLRARVHRLAQRRLPRRRRDRRGGIRAVPGSSRSCRCATPSRPPASARRSPFPRTPIRSPSSPASSASSPAAKQAGRILERLAARADVDLDPAETWLLARLDRDPGLDLAAARRVLRDRARLTARERLARSSTAGLITVADEPGTHASRELTEAGEQTLEHALSCGRERLDELATGWQPEQHPELRELINALAGEFIDTTPTPVPA